MGRGLHPLVVLSLLLGFASGCPHAPSVEGPEGQAVGSGVAVSASQARSVLEQGAGDLDVAVRARALWLLIRWAPEPAGGTWGPRATWDPSPWVRRAAVEALARRIDEPESAALLEELVRREVADPFTRGAAGLRLAAAGRVATLPELLQAWRAVDEPWLAAPLALAAARMGDPDALGVVDGALRGGELPLELGFIEDIGVSGLSDLAPGLRIALGEVEEDLVLPLAAALLTLGDDAGAGPFRDALGSTDPQRQLEAVDFLLPVTGEPALSLLQRAAHAGLPATQAYARVALVGRGEGSLAEVLAALASEDREVRAVAAEALARADLSGAPGRERRQVRRAILVALADPDEVVRPVAARALAAQGALEDLGEPALATALSSDWPALRVEAAGAVLALSSPSPAGSAVSAQH